ncbi:hypothetical protein JHK87_018776 [Glycine soja]|nr:hypothetical protein JHK87_018776 [Glycine soja]
MLKSWISGDCQYYDAVMPYLKAILVNATDKSNHMLCATSMECISLVGMVVGNEKFRADANQVMEVLMSLQVSQMETNDPTTIGIMQISSCRVCFILSLLSRRENTLNYVLERVWAIGYLKG